MLPDAHLQLVACLHGSTDPEVRGVQKKPSKPDLSRGVPLFLSNFCIPSPQDFINMRLQKGNGNQE